MILKIEVMDPWLRPQSILQTVICNQRPTVNDDARTITESQPIDIPVTENDTDPENDSIKVNEVTEHP